MYMPALEMWFTTGNMTPRITPFFLIKITAHSSQMREKFDTPIHKRTGIKY